MCQERVRELPGLAGLSGEGSSGLGQSFHSPPLPGGEVMGGGGFGGGAGNAYVRNRYESDTILGRGTRDEFFPWFIQLAGKSLGSRYLTFVGFERSI